MPPSSLTPVLTLLAALAFPATAVPLERDGPPATAAAAKRVKVVDNAYSPKRLTVTRGTTIRWRWSRRNANTHDVYLDERPRRAARFHSPPASTGFSFKRKLRRPGIYKVLCTFHEGMSMRIAVRRRR